MIQCVDVLGYFQKLQEDKLFVMKGGAEDRCAEQRLGRCVQGETRLWESGPLRRMHLGREGLPCGGAIPPVRALHVLPQIPSVEMAGEVGIIY